MNAKPESNHRRTELLEDMGQLRQDRLVERERREQMAGRGRALMCEVRRLELGKVEYRLAELVIEYSYGWGNEALVVPELDDFAVLIGLAKPHVHTNLAALMDMGLLAVEKTLKGKSYSIVPNPKAWICRRKPRSKCVEDTIEKLKVFNNVAAQEELPHFFEPRNGAPFLNSRVTADVTLVTAEELQ